MTSTAAASGAVGVLDPLAETPLGAGSILRRVVAEPVTALMVQRALVMEVAHPKVAAGVDQHSGFRGRPLSRAWATADAALRLVFGDSGIARGAARQIYRTHDRINGPVGERAGDWEAGEHYSAHDASLLTWVWTTLIDSAEVAYTRWVRPFTPNEAEAFYREALAFAGFLGIPTRLLPPDQEAFSRELEAMLAGGLLGTTETSRRVAAEVLWFRHRCVAPPVVRLQRAIALATLDPRLVSRLGLRPEIVDVDARLGGLIDAQLGRWYCHLPGARRSLPSIYLFFRRPTIGLAATLARRSS